MKRHLLPQLLPTSSLLLLVYLSDLARAEPINGWRAAAPGDANEPAATTCGGELAAAAAADEMERSPRGKLRARRAPKTRRRANNALRLRRYKATCQVADDDLGGGRLCLNAQSAAAAANGRRRRRRTVNHTKPLRS